MTPPENDLWQALPLAPGEHRLYTLPPRRVYVSRIPDECRVAVTDADGESANAQDRVDALPPDLTWTRFMVPSELTQVALRPVLPDRPLVIRPAEAVSIVPGHRTILFVSLPVWFRVELSGDSAAPVTLMETPSLTLSKSWFGVPDNGESCYALKTRARHSMADLTDTRNRAICFLKLQNRSTEVLLIERFCLRTPTLRLYRASDDRLWCSDVTAVFTGRDAPVLVKAAAATPRHAAESVLLAPPRQPIAGSVRERTYSHVRSWVRAGA